MSSAEPRAATTDDRLAEAGHPRPLRIAMALYKDVTHDSRVLREAGSLADAGHDVTIYCLGGRLPADARFRAIAAPAPASAIVPGPTSPFLRDRASGRIGRAVRRVRWLWGYIRSARRWGRRIVDAAGPVDVWHAHDLNALAAVGPFLGRDVALVYDSHEEFLETGSARHLPGLARGALRRLERSLVARSFAVVTVNDGIASDLRQAYSPQRLVVVRNCPPRWTPPAERPARLRQAFDIPPAAPVLLFHGSLVPDRGIEEILRAIRRPELQDVHLVLLGDGELAEPMRQLAETADLAGRLHVHPAVPPAALPEWVASADVGIVIIPPRTRNLYLSTPNKLFECLAVGTPVLASDLPEMRRAVMDDPDGPLGAVCDPDDEDAVAAAVVKLVRGGGDQLEVLRERCLKAARLRLNWEHEAARLTELYAEIAAGRGGGAAGTRP